MPDLALEQTERQIFKLLDAASGRKIIFLELYALPTLTRGEWGQRHLSRMNYRGVKDLWNRRLDGLIVTGAEPRAADLTLETYWRTLTEVFDWAENNTISTIASCLAVHAAVFHFDRINRYPLDKKCFGVFNFKRISDDQLFGGNPTQFQMPHSRWKNEIRERDLASCGYDVLVKADHHGVDTFVKRRRNLLCFSKAILNMKHGRCLVNIAAMSSTSLQVDRKHIQICQSAILIGKLEHASCIPRSSA